MLFVVTVLSVSNTSLLLLKRKSLWQLHFLRKEKLNKGLEIGKLVAAGKDGAW